jgi:hypothetical protein
VCTHVCTPPFPVTALTPGSGSAHLSFRMWFLSQLLLITLTLDYIFQHTVGLPARLLRTL